MVRSVLMLAALAMMMVTSNIARGPEPLYPLPSRRQLAWQKMERYAFVHFGPNTFSGNEWGTGAEDPASFNPKQLDCNQWVRSFKSAGMTGVIITAKHHDGFCLWPSKFSTHTVAKSPWQSGHGDVLKELSDACRRGGLKLGVYLSPWDRNHPDYGTPGYNEVFASMLQEVLSSYGPIFEVWFDGANGEGPNGKKQVYDWPLFVATVRRLQPHAVIFSDAGPDIRWVGNEGGYAGERNWNTIDRKRYVPGTPLYEELTEGAEGAPDWVPSECDVSIRPGWFWRQSEDSKVKPLEQLIDIWFGSVGRGSNLLLNVPPNDQGLIAAPDVARLEELGRALADLKDFPVKPSRVEDDGNWGPGFGAQQANDDSSKTFWAGRAGARSGSIILTMDQPQGFDTVEITEPLELGQRIRKFSVQAWVKGKWLAVANGSTVGKLRLLRVNGVDASRVRLNIVDARATPLVSTFKLYRRQDAKS